VAGDPGALLDIVCRLWQGRAGGVPPVQPPPPLQEQLNYEAFAASVRAHLAAGTPADVEPDEITPGVKSYDSVADLMDDLMASLPPIE